MPESDPPHLLQQTHKGQGRVSKEESAAKGRQTGTRDEISPPVRTTSTNQSISQRQHGDGFPRPEQHNQPPDVGEGARFSAMSLVGSRVH
mmetsp:Transcript_657/g.1363  ORF Transcript_657/g.1363 Transcript_657/m.1363 type:complete len:90 (-) Transcript_657:2090-2359(-)